MLVSACCLCGASMHESVHVCVVCDVNVCKTGHVMTCE